MFFFLKCIYIYFLTKIIHIFYVYKCNNNNKLWLFIGMIKLNIYIYNFIYVFILKNPMRIKNKYVLLTIHYLFINIILY